MATLERKHNRSKKSRIRFENPEEVDLSNDNVIKEENEENTPLINANEFMSESNSVREDSTEITSNTMPSAPAHEEYEPNGLQNNKIRSKFMQKVYAILMCQLTIFCGLITLFVYIPHLKKIFRKWVFDPLFYTSFIGIPLCIAFILLIISPSIRRKFAFTTMILITTCLSLLISYAITQSTAKAFLYSTGSSDLCCLGIIFGSSSKRIDFTKWKYISLTPIFMIGSSALAPTLLKTSLNNTIWPSIIMSGLMTYLGANTRPVIRYNDLNIEPNEYLFASTQLYLQPEQAIKHRLKNWICGPERNRTSYATI